MGLGHCGLGTAPMPNENLSGESGHQQPGRGGEQGNKERQGDTDISVCLKVKENERFFLAFASFQFLFF